MKFIHVLIHDGGADISVNVNAKTVLTIYAAWARLAKKVEINTLSLHDFMLQAKPGDSFTYGCGIFIASSGRDYVVSGS